jgi:hypothetical protein
VHYSRRGQGAKGNRKVEDTQHRPAPCSIQIESRWVKGEVRHPIPYHTQCLSYLSRKSDPLPRITDGGPAPGDAMLSTRRLNSRRQWDRILPNRWRADPRLHDRYQDLGQAQASPLQPLVCYGHPVVRRRRLVLNFLRWEVHRTKLRYVCIRGIHCVLRQVKTICVLKEGKPRDSA